MSTNVEPSKTTLLVWGLVITVALLLGGIIGFSLGHGANSEVEQEDDIQTTAFWINWDEMSSQERQDFCYSFHTIGAREAAKIAEDYGLDGQVAVRNYREACG